MQEIKPAKDNNKNKKLDYESSEEEKTDLVIDQNITVLNKADVETQKRKKQQEEEDSASGWKKLESHSKDATFTTSHAGAAKSGPLGAQPRGLEAASGKPEISFGRGPPKFTKKSNQKRLDEDFPELDAVGQKAQDGSALDSEVSKKDRTDIGMFRSEARQPREQQEPVEERKQASKPVFTSSKKKMLVGGD